MANKKYKLANGDYWETSGIYDIAQADTQKNINAAVATELAGKASKNNGVYFAECTTPEATYKKQVTIENGPSALSDGIILVVHFSYSSGSSYPPELQVTSRIGGTDIPLGTTGISGPGGGQASWYVGDTVVFSYFQYGWNIISTNSLARTDRYGLVKLNSDVNSESTYQAATPSAVKQAYDLASTIFNYTKYDNNNTTEIEANTTIASISDPGDYECSDSAVLATISDNPYPGQAFRLMVFTLTRTFPGQTGVCLQIYCPKNTWNPLYRVNRSNMPASVWHTLGSYYQTFSLIAKTGDQTFTSNTGVHSGSRILEYSFDHPENIGSTLSYTTGANSVTFSGTVYAPTEVRCVFGS